MLKFSFRNVVSEISLENMVQVTNFKALRRDQLPHAYLTRYPNCYTIEKDGVPYLVINYTANDQAVFSKGQLISPITLTNVHIALKNSGENLHRVKKYIAKKKAQWETKRPRSMKF